jgi:hypothetical protein
MTKKLICICIIAYVSLVINCSSKPSGNLYKSQTDKKSEVQPDQKKNIQRTKIKTVFKHLPEEDTVKLSMETPIEVIYKDIILKVANDKYAKALEEIDFLLRFHTSPQPYIIEAHILQLIILSAQKTAYLNLANNFDKGWQTVINMPEKSLSTQDRIERLDTLSRISIEYYYKHKETSVKLLRSHDSFSQIPDHILENRLRIIGIPFTKSGSLGNPALTKAVTGNYVETEERLDAELVELHNNFTRSWWELAGKGSRISFNINDQPASNSYKFSNKGFLYWIADALSRDVKNAPKEAFGDNQELRTVILARSEEITSKAKKIK